MKILSLKTAFIADVLLIAIVIIAFFTLFYFERPRVFCSHRDYGCIALAGSYKANCTPSMLTVELGNLTDRMTIYMDINKAFPFGECLITETIINHTGKGMGGYNLTGYSTDCVRNPDGSTRECNGSVYEYLLSTLDEEAIEAISNMTILGASSGDGGGNGEEPPAIEYVYASLYDDEAKQEAIDHIDWCTPSVLVVTDLTRSQDPVNTSYWVKKFTVTRGSVYCNLHVEITSAINLPPEIPLEIIGMYMDCSYPLADIPKDEISKVSCVGELADYFWKV